MRNHGMSLDLCEECGGEQEVDIDDDGRAVITCPKCAPNCMFCEDAGCVHCETA